MRDLVFKNLTSDDKKRKIISTSEIVDNRGVRSIVRRHFVYLVKELKEDRLQKPSTHVYILKERNTREQKEKFFCKIKGCVYAVSNDKLFLILFTHSLKIDLLAMPQDLRSIADIDNIL